MIKANSYKKSGVDIRLANKFVNHISKITKKNRKLKSKFNNIGSFASFYDISKHKIKDPVIVSATDGVGTKIDLAIKFNALNTIGIDLVAMCVNDLIVQGAKPLFFLDYIAVEQLNLAAVKKIIKGIMRGCKMSNCELVGGETAEMPGIYKKGKIDLAGFATGIISKKKIIGSSKVKVNDIILAVPSSGVHSNGFSLVRKVINKKKVSKKIINTLLTPTRIYTNEIQKLYKKNLLSAAANITGGGIIENLIRSVPKNLTAQVDFSKIRITKIFKWLKNENISEIEMLKTFNCGVGFCLLVNEKNVSKVVKIFPNKFKPYKIGQIIKGNKRFKIINKLKW